MVSRRAFLFLPHNRNLDLADGLLGNLIEMVARNAASAW